MATIGKIPSKAQLGVFLHYRGSDVPGDHGLMPLSNPVGPDDMADGALNIVLNVCCAMTSLSKWMSTCELWL